MKTNKLMRVEDLVNNPTARVPICLCLDTSGSMGAVTGDVEYTGETVFEDGQEWNIVRGGTSRIDELNKGINLFYNAIMEDDIARYAAEICVVTFADTAECIEDFSNIDRQKIPQLSSRGNTSMGEGVNLALDLLEQRKREYKEAGVDYYQPWLVLMTDGEPNGNNSEYSKAMSRVKDAVDKKRLTVFPIGIGEDADMEALRDFSPKRQPLKLKGLKFQEFFAWLSQSVSRTSQSTPGEAIPLDVAGIQGWGEL